MGSDGTVVTKNDEEKDHSIQPKTKRICKEVEKDNDIFRSESVE